MTYLSYCPCYLKLSRISCGMYPLKKSSKRISRAKGLSLCFMLRHFSIIVWSSLSFYVKSCNWCGLYFTIAYLSGVSPYKSLPGTATASKSSYGILPIHSSNRIHPKAHMSHILLSVCLNYSGAM